ncbi:MAG: type II toxin-antitoxin system VapC family toxin [Gammaproteobacteria bacterium]|nr:type II toxin-antitoxin system VapC family toxin [Gammaproteobacteria bacterium]TVQ50439.1 MAG: PIN domain-containing protein [Gammaproteobacteria bacterium]
MSAVLDASALLAWLHDEPGAERVAEALDGALVSAVNWSEVVQKLLQRGADIEGMDSDVIELGVTIEPFTAAHADTGARLWANTRKAGLSLADRACLALAQDRALPVLTADQTWVALGLDTEIVLIR